MISFVLNDRLLHTYMPAGMTLLDFIRYERNLKGTKIGCREGDCGACNVLEGKFADGSICYSTIVSCLTPLGNVHGKHIVTVEGLNMDKLSPVQELLVEHNGTQCGFCTPGFVISLTSFLLSERHATVEEAIAAMDGNICRCTGYKSIERAAEELVRIKAGADGNDLTLGLIQKGYLPAYFGNTSALLKEIERESIHQHGGQLLGGGTDLLVQKPDEILESKTNLLFDRKDLKGIRIEGGKCMIGAEATATDIMESGVLLQHFSNIKKHFKLVSSTPIRNMGTLGGNIVNASPIGDLTIFYLALDASLHLNRNGRNREVKLKDFFIDYKNPDIEPGEIIEALSFEIPSEHCLFNFEKVCKRTHLDIASVNSAISLQMDGDHISAAHLSAGGVSPIPLYLSETSAFLTGKPVDADTLIRAAELADQEISPISDIRGSKQYKRQLLRQLIIAHFIELFPEKALFMELQPILLA
jgi:xanthine dehydrogenase small subunit